ncbi:MAG: hypothetical protein GY856_24170 [bacterium]|nr:hypothetical protein [bacterium]
MGCTPPPPATITLLATTDMHGALDSSPDPATERPLGGAAALAATIAEERRRNPLGTLLLDAGDSLQGTAFSALNQGRAMIGFMNTVAFDAAAIGDHEFDWGVPILRDRIAQAEFPFLAANLVERESGQAPAWARPYQILERQGIRIVVIGLITHDARYFTLPENVKDYEFLHPAEIANQFLAELVPEHADIAVLLCHIGGIQDPEDGAIVGEIAELARAVDGVAAIIAGGYHGIIAGEINDIPIVEAEASGRYLGRIRLVIDGKTREILEREAEVLPVSADAVTPDPGVVALLDDYHQSAERMLDEVIGEAEVDIGRTFDQAREHLLGNLLTDAVRDAVDADVAFQNPRGVRTSIAKGPIRYRDVFEVMPFDNTIVVLTLKGREIEELVQETAGADQYLFVSGLSYAGDYGKPAGSRIRILTPLEPDRPYRVAINSFMAQGGDAFVVQPHWDPPRDTGILLRDALLSWIKKETAAGRKIRAQVEGRIIFE